MDMGGACQWVEAVITWGDEDFAGSLLGTPWVTESAVVMWALEVVNCGNALRS